MCLPPLWRLVQRRRPARTMETSNRPSMKVSWWRTCKKSCRIPVLRKGKMEKERLGQIHSTRSWAQMEQGHQMLVLTMCDCVFCGPATLVLLSEEGFSMLVWTSPALKNPALLCLVEGVLEICISET
ncbi:hypothetical protein DUNSADRAFT_7753 [Dunaliella salina]|uniref:Encoded protein n=1 Tax=Dunaliella salina TaxID=3046 RepID=A0ABQ7GKV0_DUNSA|nr:hypothetical protein DUNSADRAFT_7753 [Dunaliella salina]|eukprot:KAF5835211.1 hypothetical protein DUNSADRAFT_7753 [Dunaliella salina]